MKYVWLKKNEHKRFDFFPRFFDPVKNDLEMRVDLAESDAKRELRQAQVHDKMQSYRQHGKAEFAMNSDRTVLLVRLVLMVLLTLTFWLFYRYGDMFSVLFEEFPKTNL